MGGILKVDNVYVCFENKELNTEMDINLDKNVSMVVKDRGIAILYGGRVKVYDEKLYIDGFRIHRVHYAFERGDEYWRWNDPLSISSITAYLNQIENLGVDTFLDNYKRQVECFKLHIEEELKQLIEDETAKDRKDRIENRRHLLTFLAVSLFNLLVNMNAGLENSAYIEAYNQIACYFS